MSINIELDLLAKSFWENQINYPNFPFSKERRFYDLKFLFPFASQWTSLTDLGCGTGEIDFLLSLVTNIKEYNLYDIGSYINYIPYNKYFKIFNEDFLSVNLPQTDGTICLGVIFYIINNQLLSDFFSKIISPTFIIRCPCNSEDLIINKISKELDKENLYVAHYRTVKDIINLLNPYFTSIISSRIYPDEIESKFGTKQYGFICKK